MNRVFFHYEDLEEFKCGMWKIVRGEQRTANSEASASLMRDIPRFKIALYRAVEEWPKSCQQSMTSDAVNRIAFLGHAACCIGVGSPEENTRIGWHLLNQREQDAANLAAKEVLDYWENIYMQEVQLELFGLC